MNKMKKELVGSIYESDLASPGLLFWRAFYNWQGFVRVELEKFEVTQVQFSILAALTYLSSGGLEVTQQQIADQLSMDKMTVSEVVKTLVTKKLIHKKRHATDARSYALSVTKTGLTKIKQCVPVVEETDEKFFRSIGTKFELFVEALKMLALKQK